MAIYTLVDINKMNLRTGDILLFDERPYNACAHCFDSLIKCWTHSKYSHSAIVLKDPKWLGVTQTCVWESTGFNGLDDIVDHRKKFGVQIQNIDEYSRKFPGHIQAYVRRVSDQDHKKFTASCLQEIRQTVKDAPYDIWPPDWVEVASGCGPKATDKRFWCSAFVGYILVRTGVLSEDTDWSALTCQSLSSQGTNILKTYGVDTPIYLN